MNPEQKRILVFIGSSDGKGNRYLLAAKRLAELMHEHGFALIYGGGLLGCMVMLARTLKELGGYVIGITTHFFADHEGVFDANEVIRLDNIHDRKCRMLMLASAVIVMPGGQGTLEETAAAGTDFQFDEELRKKLVIFVNLFGFYDGLKRQYEVFHEEAFITERIPFNPIFVNTPEEAIQILADHFAAQDAGNVTQLHSAA